MKQRGICALGVVVVVVASCRRGERRCDRLRGRGRRAGGRSHDPDVPGPCALSWLRRCGLVALAIRGIQVAVAAAQPAPREAAEAGKSAGAATVGVAAVVDDVLVVRLSWPSAPTATKSCSRSDVRVRRGRGFRRSGATPGRRRCKERQSCRAGVVVVLVVVVVAAAVVAVRAARRAQAFEQGLQHAATATRAWGMGHRLQSELSCGVLGYMGFCQSLGSPPCFQEVYAKFEKMCTNSMQSCSIWLYMMCVQHVCMLSWHHDIIHTPAGHCMYILCATA